MAFPADWTKRCPITIAAGTVSELLTDYPLLLTEANLPASIFTDANADGSDIRFSSDEDGTAELAVEIVPGTFDPIGQTAQIYTKPSISAVADTTIQVWFKNPAATMPAADSAFGSQAVWSNGFAAVWHLEESGDGTAGEYKDSTANANHGQGGGGTAGAVPTRVAGVVGYGQSFDGGDYIKLPTSPDVAANDTISFWLYLPAGAGAGVLWMLLDSETSFGVENNQYSIFIYESTLYRYVAGNCAFAGTVPVGSLVHVCSTYAGGTVTNYLNGEFNASYSQTKTPSTTVLACIGSRGVAYKYTGSLDSPRIANVARSPAWIAADVASQSSPGTFATAGAVVDVGGSTPVAASLGGRFFRRGSTPQFIGAMAFRR